jgi:hypothetical protein
MLGCYRRRAGVDVCLSRRRTASAPGDHVMRVELRWKSSLSATCLHAAACWSQGIPAANAELGAALESSIALLVAEVQDALWPVGAVLPQLAGLSAEYENNRELVTRAVARLRIQTTEGLISRVAGAIADVEAALRRARPEIVEELAVRGGPLRQQWDARGPGMLHQIGRLTAAAVVPEFAEIVLVAPYAGGHGEAYPAQNRIALEAVLVNPHPELPEPIRIAWLLAQLTGDLPQFAEVLPPGRAGRAFQLAMLAPALDAGVSVELLASCDEATVDAALDTWRLREGLPADAASRLWQWWSAWLDGSSKWPVAVAALDQLLAD